MAAYFGMLERNARIEKARGQSLEQIHRAAEDGEGMPA